jgi:hypothetical protein
MPQSRIKSSPQDLDDAIETLQRRVVDVEKLNIEDTYYSNRDNEKRLLKSIRESILVIFGEASPEYAAHRDISFDIEPIASGLSDDEIIAAKERGRTRIVAALNELIARLEKMRSA